MTDIEHASHVEPVATELVAAVRALSDHEGDSLYALLRLAYLLAEVSPQLTMLVAGALRSAITSGMESDIDSWGRSFLIEGSGRGPNRTAGHYESLPGGGALVGGDDA